MTNKIRLIFGGYEETVRILNNLKTQKNTEDCLQIGIRNKKLSGIIKFLNRSGITLTQLDELSVIHVSGTKGKGSTCALTESILRTHGVTTGLFSSPHLISVSERIVLNGISVSKNIFTQFFWRVLHRLRRFRDHDKDLPAYFMFLTILSFHIFLGEKVQVAIIEVGIGGENDCTNVIRNTKTVGITTLGLDHTSILGNSLEDISWQKAGIIKKNSIVYTNEKNFMCLKILKKKAKREYSKLYCVPDINIYKTLDSQPLNYENLSKIVQLSGSMAIQLSYNWLKQKNKLTAEDLSNSARNLLSDKTLEGLKACLWMGRFEILQFKNFRIHMDGAHTLESMSICSKWFKDIVIKSKMKILIFNVTAGRNSKEFLNILQGDNKFNFICLVPNLSSTKSNQNDVSIIDEQINFLKIHTFYRNEYKRSSTSIKIFTNILECLLYLRKVYPKQDISILVTGSLHLVGHFKESLQQLKNFLKL